MEDCLYETPSTGNFLVHFVVVNDGEDPLYVDLRSYRDIIRPIQYTESGSPDIQVIDIITSVPPPLTDSLRQAEISASENGSLLRIDGYGQLDYYADFNAAGRSRIDSLTTPWLLIAAGGWLTVTDGTNVERLQPEGGFVYVPIALPVTWGDVPNGSVVWFDSSGGPRVKRLGSNRI